MRIVYVMILTLRKTNKKTNPLLFVLILASCVCGQEKSAKGSITLPFDLGVGLSLYKPAMTDANNFFQSYHAGRFGSGRGHDMKFILKKDPRWIVTLDSTRGNH